MSTLLYGATASEIDRQNGTLGQGAKTNDFVSGGLSLLGNLIQGGVQYLTAKETANAAVTVAEKQQQTSLITSFLNKQNAATALKNVSWTSLAVIAGVILVIFILIRRR